MDKARHIVPTALLVITTFKEIYEQDCRRAKYKADIALADPTTPSYFWRRILKPGETNFSAHLALLIFLNWSR